MKTLYLDCFSGISGDMTVGALIDAGADFATIEAGLRSLGVDGYHLTHTKVNKSGIMATQFEVHVAPADAQGHAHDHAHPHTHAHSHDHGHGHAHSHSHEHTHAHGHTHSHDHGHAPHRHLPDIERLIGASALPGAVKHAAIETFRLLGEAEAAVHGTTIDKVHFHEVGAIDSIVDIVAAQYALYLLEIEQVICSPLAVGAGTVKCDHGIMPVPAPATARLLREVPTYGGGVQAELVTPTGAALVRYWAESYGPQPAMRVSALGYGSGTRDLPDRPNVLRVSIGETEEEEESETSFSDTETIAVLEANIDDQSGELVAAAMAALLEAGARDAFITPVLGKKGRPAQRITVLCDTASAELLARVLLTHSSTFGVRMREERRIVLERTWKTVETPWGDVRVKLGSLDGEVLSTSPEYDDCAALAKAATAPVRRVYEAALAAAIKGVWKHV
jgi:uncharacterized protein (TIGR00299 family) protein